jgi:hypothetical protein
MATRSEAKGSNFLSIRCRATQCPAFTNLERSTNKKRGCLKSGKEHNGHNEHTKHTKKLMQLVHALCTLTVGRQVRATLVFFVFLYFLTAETTSFLICLVSAGQTSQPAFTLDDGDRFKLLTLTLVTFI